MLLPIKWLRDYVDIDENTKTIADKVTDTGSHVESIEDRSEGLEGVVVAKITKIERHPDADKLVICTMDTGSENLTVVTGAPNVFEGAIVPLAKVGAKLAGGVKIEKSKLRGIESDGMLCSLEELGYDNSVISKEYRNGIYIFPEGTEIGQDALDALDLNKEVIEFEITPNRPDCLSIIGMAREAAATFNTKLKEPEIKIENEVDNISDYFKSVEIETDNCSRFYSRVIKDVKIKESPLWLQNYLMSAGVRPVNNIVDITNFVMLECGQPLHAYDLEYIKTKKIVVRMAKNEEEFTTLDNEKRILFDSDIVITDGEKTIGLAGIMGGLDSEVMDTTVNVLLEGANFNSECIRKTSKRLGLRSEASMRFEKGLDPNTAKIAVDRAAQLIELISAGTIISGNLDDYKKRLEAKKINLRADKVNRLIGFEITKDEMAKLLNRLEIETEIVDEGIICTVPTFRPDINIEEDLIEEIARIYGYHNIEPKPLEGKLSVGGRSKLRNLEDRIKTVLLAMGYNELITFSFVGKSVFEKLNIKSDDNLRNAVEIINPLGEEFSIMRTTLVPNLLEILANNEHRGNENVGGFEFGNTFYPVEGQLPGEEKKLSFGFYDLGDFYFLKETLSKIFWKVGVKDLEFKRANVTYLHPGRSAEVFYKGESFGVFGEVHPEVLENFSMKKKAYVGEILFEKLLKLAIPNYLYKELPKYPAVKRDLAFLMDLDVEAYSIEEIVKENAQGILEDFNVFDIYTGKGIEEGKKSLAFSMTFRADDRTLKDNEITAIVNNVIEGVATKLGGKLRE
ncbi:phenylalanine--tRNA ligase subunit beta [Peptoniphilus catoniae]|uniref:phenylalanine--tRNA ligase subunit beta n=1 Tax=Peptoniphilus catoniae TaxID=1660341 RepID=UPI0010FEA73E|nr:phenylalanine--tRNA ligase subunit beta [Peptoniphilus catoniae]